MFNSNAKGATMAAPAQNVTALPNNVVKLSKAITTHAGNASEIKFSPLTAGVLMRRKRLPVSIKSDSDGNQTVDVDYALAASYISDLTGIDEAVLEQMSPTDFAKCIAKVIDMVNDAGN